jgi:hypothetical protein
MASVSNWLSLQPKVWNPTRRTRSGAEPPAPVALSVCATP